MKAQVLMLKQDDPFKCTSAKLVKFGLAQSVKYIPRYALTLNPFSENLLSKQDTKSYKLFKTRQVINCRSIGWFALYFRLSANGQ